MGNIYFDEFFYYSLNLLSISGYIESGNDIVWWYVFLLTILI